jgi:hypothetical protein
VEASDSQEEQQEEPTAKVRHLISSKTKNQRHIDFDPHERRLPRRPLECFSEYFSYGFFSDAAMYTNMHVIGHIYWHTSIGGLQQVSAASHALAE